MPDLDQIFQYCTPKYVYIRDAKLGIMKYSLMFMIFLYVICYEILYTCDHLTPHHAQGFGTLSMEHPVQDCDPLDAGCLNKYHNIASLKYCSQFKAAKPERKLTEDGKEDEPKDEKAKADADPEEDGSAEVGDFQSKQKTCRYLDNRRLSWEGSVPSEIFVPTRYVHIVQKLNEGCYDPDSEESAKAHGLKQFRCKTAWQTDSKKDYYIADIEKFSLSMEHSFSSPSIGKFGVSNDYQGIFAACPTNHPLDVKTACKRMKVPNSHGDTAPEDIVGLSSAEEMDVASLRTTKSGADAIDFGDLLKLTPVAQQYGLTDDILDIKLPDGFGHPGKSLREVGGMLLLDVDYSNDGYMRPGLPVGPQIKPITYTYRPYFVPTKKNEKFQLVERSDYSHTRTIDIWYGVTIKMQFNGKLVAFTWAKMLTAMTTGLVLLSMATTIVSALAAYVLPLKEKYCLLMYQMSEDFSDFSILRRNAANFAGLKSVFYSGDLLQDKLAPDGTPNKELTNAEIVKILCCTEMRLNRCDGQDPRVVFETGAEANKMNKCIGRAEKEFYGHSKLAIPEDMLKKMAFNIRINSGME